MPGMAAVPDTVVVQGMAVVRYTAALVDAGLQHTAAPAASLAAVAIGIPGTAAEGRLLAAEVVTGKTRRKNRTTSQL